MSVYVHVQHVQTFGLEAHGSLGLVLVTNVVRTRIRDMEQTMDNDQQQSTLTTADSILVDPTPESDEGFVKEVKA
ncbi:hypothetical protein JRO89_XS01G0394100 [Xanthoceras sorbifolium]|uniref:Uncharacterized protein n=1 Tax=Xanthoceras sorbifolium TaxID=99658 RepID=A0ABQ8IPR3_9ROSI|nr:hypothetical protein JRO89_XS01G0394100 [Xanthoceras sorbifolium]